MATVVCKKNEKGFFFEGRDYDKLVVPDRTQDKDVLKTGHQYVVVEECHDTNRENKYRGVLFVTVRHDTQGCTSCKIEQDAKKRELFEKKTGMSSYEIDKIYQKWAYGDLPASDLKEICAVWKQRVEAEEVRRDEMLTWRYLYCKDAKKKYEDAKERYDAVKEDFDKATERLRKADRELKDREDSWFNSQEFKGLKEKWNSRIEKLDAFLNSKGIEF